MTDFAQAFQNDQNNISDAVERDRSAASQVSAKSHDFFDVHGGIYLLNAFPSPIIRITLFSTSQKLAQASLKNFLWIKVFLF